jgi:hypothetical protein
MVEQVPNPEQQNEGTRTGTSNVQASTIETESNQETLRYCHGIADAYKKGSLTKARAYAEIQNKIQSKVVEIFEGDQTRADTAFEAFIALIENLDNELNAATRRGERVVDNREPATERAGERTEPAREDDRDEGQDNSRKRAKPDESAYPWIIADTIRTPFISANLKRTLDLLELYSIDPKSTKHSLTNSASCPEFTDSEWKNVISGRAVNLDAVLSGQFSTSNDDMHTETVGDFEISYGTISPSKVVATGGDWSIAWNRTVRATAFAFPHRSNELTEYGEYITSLFAATNPAFHDRIIAFDKAVRRQVGSVRNVELSDHDKFADLKIAHIDSIGVSIIKPQHLDRGKPRDQKMRKGKIREPCNKWNEGRCSKTSEDCRRLHVCNRCSKGGHVGSECKK